MLGARAQGLGGVVVSFLLAGIMASCSRERPAPAPAPLERASLEQASSPQGAAASSAKEAEAKEAAPKEPATPITAISQAKVGGTVALGTLGGARVAFIADEDDKAVRAVDLATRGEIARAPLPSRPGQLLITPDGRLAVALRDASAVILLEATAGPSLREAAKIATAAEPLGLAVTPDGETLLVASGWGRKLAAFSLKTRESRFAVDLPREPRAVLVTDDGARAYVSHAVGSAISVVSLSDEAHGAPAMKLGGEDFGLQRGGPVVQLGGEDFGLERGGGCVLQHRAHRRAAVQGYALASLGNRVFAPYVMVHQDAEQRMTGGYGGDGEAFLPEEPSLAVIEGSAPSALLRTREAAHMANTSRTTLSFQAPVQGSLACLLPRAAAANPGRSSVLVTCLGADTVVEVSSKPAGLRETEIARWKVPPGPMGVAVDAPSQKAYVWSQFARSLSVIELGSVKAPRPPSAGEVSLPPAPLASELVLRSPPLLDAKLELGRRLFHAAGDRRISADGRACASCHPDGRDDGIVWSSPSGERQTPMLAGRLETSAPYGWAGDTKTVAEHLAHTFKRLGGKGLKGEDLDALVAYALAMPAPPREERPLDAVAARGRDLFTSQETGCSVCHTEGGSRADGVRHDVGSGAPLDTPTLRFIAGTGPYFHDGRYATLGELLRATQGKMGWASGLTDADFKALEVYIETL